MWLLVAAVGAGAGYWWYNQSGGEDAHAQRLKDEERVKAKAKELKEAGKAQ